MNTSAFYDYTPTRRWPARLAVPFQRVARRLLRPILERLRDSLQLLNDGQRAQEARLAAAEARVNAACAHLAEIQWQLEELQRKLAGGAQAGDAQLDSTVRQLAQTTRALILDHTAATRRITLLEDFMLQSAIAEADTLSMASPKLSALRAEVEAHDAVKRAA